MDYKRRKIVDAEMQLHESPGLVGMNVVLLYPLSATARINFNEHTGVRLRLSVNCNIHYAITLSSIDGRD